MNQFLNKLILDFREEFRNEPDIYADAEEDRELEFKVIQDHFAKW